MFVKMEFDKAGAQIVVVSFGSCNAAIQWRQETGCQYPILVDRERQVKTAVLYVHCWLILRNSNSLLFFHHGCWHQKSDLRHSFRHQSVNGIWCTEWPFWLESGKASVLTKICPVMPQDEVGNQQFQAREENNHWTGVLNVCYCGFTVDKW